MSILDQKNYEKLVACLREARISKSVTQQAIANKIGLYQSSVAKVERLERKLDVLELIAWLDVLDLDLADFMASSGILPVKELKTEQLLSSYQADLDLKVFQSCQIYDHIKRIGHWTWDIRSNLLCACEEAFSILGVDSASFKGTFEDIKACFHPDDRVKVSQALERAIETRSDFDMRVRILTPDDEMLQVCFRGQCGYANGALQRISGTIQDLSLDQKVSELSVLRDRLAGLVKKGGAGAVTGMINSLYYPVQEIINYALLGNNLESEISAFDAELGSRMKKILRRIVSNGDKLALVLDNLTIMFKLELGEIVLNPEKQDLFLLCSRVIERIHPLIQDSGVDIVIQRNNKEPQLAVFDEDKTSKIIENLLLNAIQFSPASSTITIEFDIQDLPYPREHNVGSEQSFVCIRIIDQGEGIPEDELEYIFTPFSSSSRSLSEKDGMGIGLVIVKRLLDLQGGFILASNADGQGACFMLGLPQEASKSSSKQGENQSAAPVKESGKA